MRFIPGGRVQAKGFVKQLKMWGWKWGIGLKIQVWPLGIAASNSVLRGFPRVGCVKSIIDEADKYKLGHQIHLNWSRVCRQWTGEESKGNADKGTFTMKCQTGTFLRGEQRRHHSLHIYGKMKNLRHLRFHSVHPSKVVGRYHSDCTGRRTSFVHSQEMAIGVCLQL